MCKDYCMVIFLIEWWFIGVWYNEL